MNQLPIPIKLISMLNLKKNVDGVCCKCNYNSNYEIDELLFCGKHIYEYSVKDKLLK